MHDPRRQRQLAAEVGEHLREGRDDEDEQNDDGAERPR